MKNSSKRSLIFVLIPISISGLLFTSSAKAETSLSVGGVSLSIPSNTYEPIGGDMINVNVAYSNQSGKQILSIAYKVTDALGKTIASNSQIGVPVGASGFMNSNWFGFSFSKAVKPFTISLIVSNYGGLGDQIISAPLVLLTQPGAEPAPTVTVTAQPQPAPTVTVTAQPQPAPTVTVTAQPQPAPTVTVTATPSANSINLAVQVESLKSQISSLKNQIKKICSRKPKPKGC